MLAASNDSLRQRILAEQVRLIYQQGPVLAAGAACAAVAMTLFLWQSKQTPLLLFWLAAVFLSALLRAVLFRYYRYYTSAQTQPSAAAPNDSIGLHQASRWGARFAWGSFFAGTVWGLWPLLFYHAYSPEYLLVITTVFAGMIAVLAASGSVYLPAFYAFALPLVFPMTACHVVSGNDVLILTGWLLLMFFVVNLVLATRGNLHYRELIEARFKNIDLMAQLGEEKRVAEQAVLAKTRFIATASHDLRQPLHAMGMFVAAFENTRLCPRQQSIVSDMEKSSLALNHMFTHLLDLSRLESNAVVYEPVDFSLQELVAVLRAEIGATAAECGLEFDLQTSEMVVRSDPVLLERILRNLLSNAVRYTPTGRVTLTVDYSADKAAPTQCLISVADTGIGIPADELESIFNEYHRVSSEGAASTETQGLGLGLAIVHRLCSLMSVQLEVESVVGEGSCFTLLLELGDVERVAAVPVMQPVPASCAAVVLLVDDDVSILAATSRTLEEWGCEVLTATTARDCLAQLALARQPPDIVLTDYQLAAAETGLDIVQLVREWLDFDLPAALITGDTTPERLQQIAGSHLPVLHKPLLAEELKRLIAVAYDARLRGQQRQQPGVSGGITGSGVAAGVGGVAGNEGIGFGFARRERDQALNRQPL